MISEVSFEAGLPSPLYGVIDVIDRIRTGIEIDRENKLSLADHHRLIDAIDNFEDEFGYLPLEFEKWRNEEVEKMRRQIESPDFQ